MSKETVKKQNRTIRKKTSLNKTKKASKKATKKASKKAAKKASKKTLKRRSKWTYSKKDYQSGDGMLTTVWGPSLWLYLHTMSFNYPVKPTKEDKKNYRNFMLNLQHVLPCKYCRINLKNNYKKLPLRQCDLESRDTFSRYVYRLHEHINKMLGKTSGLSFCEVRERFEHFRSRCTMDKPKIYKYKGTRKKGKGGKKGKEKGCTEPLYGKKSKCVIKIVPSDKKCKTFQINKKCLKVRLGSSKTRKNR